MSFEWWIYEVNRIYVEESTDFLCQIVRILIEYQWEI